MMSPCIVAGPVSFSLLEGQENQAPEGNRSKGYCKCHKGSKKEVASVLGGQLFPLCPDLSNQPHKSAVPP
jgi:hypothetical protein